MPALKKTHRTREKLSKIAGIIGEKKAKDIVILDVRNLSGLCDYFIICSGSSARQVRAIYEETIRACKKNQIEIQHCEDDALGQWILVDFFDVVLHIFFSETRPFYNLEYLWNRAKKVSLNKPPK